MEIILGWKWLHTDCVGAFQLEPAVLWRNASFLFFSRGDYLRMEVIVHQFSVIAVGTVSFEPVAL